MKCLIIEDEFPAAERLRALLAKVAPQAEVLAVVESVAAGQAWLRAQPAPDLIFSDIHLSDGLSFSIFEAVPVQVPVIFTTAYDAYAIKAFQVNSIDYLLKPVTLASLQAAVAKYEAGQQVSAGRLRDLIEAMAPAAEPVYKRRFLVEARDQLIPVEEMDIAYFTTAHEVVYLMRRDGQRYPVDYTLDQLEQKLDPARFFRANRQFICHLEGIDRIHPFFNGKLKLVLRPAAGEVIVSREKARAFRQWLEGE